MMTSGTRHGAVREIPLEWRDHLLVLGTRAFAKSVFALPFGWAFRRRVVDLNARLRRPRPDVAVAYRDIAGIACRVATPAGATDVPPLVWLHGGGFVMCSPDTHARMLDALAVASRRRVVAPRYRLAPEHPFPAGFDDAAAVVRAVGRCALGGDSAGANLAAGVAAMRAAEGGAPERLVLVSPPADLDTDRPPPPCREMVLSVATVERIVAAYLAPDTDLRDPRLSPVHADWRGGPPTLIHVADGELLQADAERLAAAMARDGVEVTLEAWRGVPHDWHMAAGHAPVADRAIARIADFLGGGAGTPG